MNYRLQEQHLQYQNESVTLPIMEERYKNLIELLQALERDIKSSKSRENYLTDKLNKHTTLKATKKADYEETLMVMQSSISVNKTFEWDMAK